MDRRITMAVLTPYREWLTDHLYLNNIPTDIHVYAADYIVKDASKSPTRGEAYVTGTLLASVSDRLLVPKRHRA